MEPGENEEWSHCAMDGDSRRSARRSVVRDAHGLVSRDRSRTRVYSYISPPATAVLQKYKITEAELEDFTARGLKSRGIGPIDPNRVYEGSADALRIDIRKKTSKLVIEISVRQGGSVHNMLERWCESKLLPIKAGMQPKEMRRMLFDSILTLLDSLGSNFNSNAYKRGRMMEE